MDVDSFASEAWDTMEVRSLTEDEIERMLRHPLLRAFRFSNPPRHSYEEHAHPEAQALLLLRGELTHITRGRRYTQHPGDLLIVPAHILHTAVVGDEGIDCLFIQKAE